MTKIRRSASEREIVDLLRAGKAVATCRSRGGLVVRQAGREMPEWLTQRGGTFAWDDKPPDADWWKRRIASRNRIRLT
jgi:hypothetical protein